MRAIFTIDDAEYRVFAAREGAGHRVHVNETQLRLMPSLLPSLGLLSFDGVAQNYLLVQDGDTIHIWMEGETAAVRHHDPVGYHASHADGAAEDTILAPMPGTAIAVNVKPGGRVARGDTLLVIESMKLETAVKAPRDGVVEAVQVAVGQAFDRNAPLVVLAKAEG